MQPIDIAKLLRNKNPRLARWIPRFMIAWLEKIICLKKINHVLSTYGDEPPNEFIRSTLNYIGVSYSVHGVENIPTDGRIIFAANHPLGGLDGLILAEAVDSVSHGRSTRLIVNDLLMNLTPLEPIFVPINKHGAQNSDYARRMVELFEGDSSIITFPAGLCSRLINGHVADPEWRRSFVTKAWESGRIIVPVFVKGRNSMFFYRLAKLRKALGIKVNIEMLFLPKEMFDQRGQHIDIHFGQPIEPNTSKSTSQWVRQVRSAVYAFDTDKNCTDSDCSK